MSPPGREQHVLTYDAAIGGVVLFGGLVRASGGYFLDDTWVWDGTTWTQVLPTVKPSARYGHAMTYDAASSRVILFGGFAADTGGVTGDTWLFGERQALNAMASASPLSGSVPLPVNFTGSATGGTPPYTFDWDFGDGSQHDTTQNPSRTYTAVGNYQVTLTVTDAVSISAIAGVTIGVSPPGCTLSCSASALSLGTVGIGVPFSVTATPSGCTGTPTFEWDFGDASPHSAMQNPMHVYMGPGAYNWTLAASLEGVAHCEVTRSIAICLAPFIAATSMIPEDGVVERRQHASLSVQVVGTEPLSYQWYIGQAGDRTAPITGATADVYVTPPLLVNTSYWVHVTDACGHEIVSPPFVLTIVPVPVVLVHGWCGSPESFINMGSFLQEDLEVPVGLFEARTVEPEVRMNLSRLAARLGADIEAFMGGLRSNGLPAKRVDIVAHSMGGLLAREWMTHGQNNTKVRQLVIAGSPNFGVRPGDFKAAWAFGGVSCAEPVPEVRLFQLREMEYGSLFLKELNARWNEGVKGRFLTPESILMLIGCSLDPEQDQCVGDVVVRAGSATLPTPDGQPDYGVRYVKRVHFNDLIAVHEKDHETYQLIKNFLQSGRAVCDDDTLDCAYNPARPQPLVVAPIVGADGTAFTDKVEFQRELVSCDGSSIVKPEWIKPSGPSGWWTSTEIPEGCWFVRIKKPKTPSQAQANVVVGRPTITLPLVVQPQ
jgi:PKD repeat protein